MSWNFSHILNHFSQWSFVLIFSLCFLTVFSLFLFLYLLFMEIPTVSFIITICSVLEYCYDRFKIFADSKIWVISRSISINCHFLLLWVMFFFFLWRIILFCIWNYELHRRESELCCFSKETFIFDIVLPGRLLAQTANSVSPVVGSNWIFSSV